MNGNRLWKTAIVAGFLFSLAAPAHANAGTALMWAISFYLLIGNILIGILESLVLAVFWKLPMRSSILLMIGANYFSAFFGLLIFPLMLQLLSILFPSWALSQDRIPFDRLLGFLAANIFVYFVITVLLEWPFVLKALRRRSTPIGNIRKAAFGAVLVMNIVSYIGLSAFMYGAGETSMLTDTSYDPGASFLKGRTGHIYYYDEERSEVVKMSLDGVRDSSLKPLKRKAFSGNNYLSAIPGSEKGCWDLAVVWDDSVASGDKKSPLMLKRCFSRTTGESSDFYKFTELRDPKTATKKVQVGFWAADGISVDDKQTGKRTVYALETNFLALGCRHAYVIPGDIVIWELGGQRIMALDLNSRHITQLAWGRYPVVTLD